MTLAEVLKDEEPGVKQVVPLDQMSLYWGGSDRGPLDEDECLEQDVGLAMGMLPEFFALIDATPRVRAEHEVFRGLRRLKLDIRNILGEDVDRGFKDLCREARPITNSINRLLGFHREMRAEGLADKFLREVSDEITNWLYRDRVCTIIGRERRPPPLPPNYHLERDPLWCGLLLYNFRMAAHEGAILTANSCTFVISTAHLYNSLRQTGILRREWPDMERIFTLHRTKNLFVGDMLTTFKDGMKNFSLAMGVPLAILAKNKRKRRSDYPRATKPRKFLGILASTLWKFKTSICDGVGRGALGLDDIQDYLLQKTVEELNGPGFGPAIDTNNVFRFFLLAIQSETAEVTFDHLEMHIVCWKLLREINVALGESLPGWSKVYRDDRILPGLTMWLLSGLADLGEKATKLGLGGQSASTNLSSRTGELVESFIAREGDVASKGMGGTASFATLV